MNDLSQCQTQQFLLSPKLPLKWNVHDCGQRSGALMIHPNFFKFFQKVIAASKGVEQADDGASFRGAGGES